jgi:hypothetical protein
MTVQRTVYTSPVDALTALIRSRVVYEQRYQMSSSDFYPHYQRGEVGMRPIWWSGLGATNTTCSSRQNLNRSW